MTRCTPEYWYALIGVCWRLYRLGQCRRNFNLVSIIGTLVLLPCVAMSGVCPAPELHLAHEGPDATSEDIMSESPIACLRSLVNKLSKPQQYVYPDRYFIRWVGDRYTNNN